MIGIFVFKAKPDDKDYKYKKDPKTPLKLSDEELVHFVKITPKMTYFCYHREDRDKLPDEEKVLVDMYYNQDMTKKEIHQAVEGLYHNLNTLQSRSGNQLPFTSINYGTCILPEGASVRR